VFLPSIFDRRRQQNDCFQKIVQTYETEPVNMKQLIALMQEVQEYGQPPSDIIQAIAPGIALDDNGVPIMNATGGTTFPPFGGTNHNDDDCCVM
jgi:Pex19 protein family